MYVLGTAGHVDHGKSTLVAALTGTHPDRWAEEQRREMTIDLGFGWFTTPAGHTVSLVDVPGHERFIKNMLAGVGGIAAALLVIAADEGVMPQTREHLAILDLLEVQQGLVVLTKCDLVEADWLALVREDVAATLADTTLAAAPHVAVSARTGQGMPTLLAALDALLAATPTRTGAQGTPRLPIDRAFAIGGFGTVVTGTLLDGPLLPGQAVALLPRGLTGRVRNVQTHQQQREQALAGTRVAVNLAGVHHSAVQRGDVLTLPGALEPTRVLDVRLRLLPDAPRALAHNAALELFVGAAEVRCRAALLDSETLAPGASGWAQLRLERPIAAARGERCILRQPAHNRTVGGGVIVDTHPARHRRFRPAVLRSLEVLLRGTPDDLLLHALGDMRLATHATLAESSGLPPDLAAATQHALLERGVLRAIGPDYVATATGWEHLVTRLHAALDSYHQRYPLRQGMPREELRRRLDLDARTLAAVLTTATHDGLAAANATVVWQPDHTPTPTPAQEAASAALLAQMARQPYSPPAPDLDADVLTWLVGQGRLCLVGAVYFLPTAYEAMHAWVLGQLGATSSVTVAQVRDQFGTSRKYALALLEHLDAQKITRRVGDERVPW